jgi:hypothetical protein
MRAKLLTGNELEGLRNLHDDSGMLLSRAKTLVRALVNEFSGTSVGGIDLLVTQAEGDRILAKISSKFGAGRLVMAYHTEGTRAIAQIVVERHAIDARERETWEPVMVIQLPKPDWIMDGEPLSDSDKTFVLGASILHAIINGPMSQQ